MKDDKERFAMEIDKNLKEELREYGERPDVDRSMGWLVGHFVKEGLARAKEKAHNDAVYQMAEDVSNALHEGASQ